MIKKEGDKDDLEISEKKWTYLLSVEKNRLNDRNDLIFKDDKNGSK